MERPHRELRPLKFRAFSGSDSSSIAFCRKAVEDRMPKNSKRSRKRRMDDRTVARFSASTGLTKLSVIELFRRFGPLWLRNVDFRIES